MRIITAFFLQIITIALLIFRPGRFAKAVGIILVISLVLIAYFDYHSNVCSEYMCGMGDAIGTLGVIYGVGTVALVLALIPRKKKPQ